MLKRYRSPDFFKIFALVIASCAIADLATSQVIPPGDDCWQTPPFQGTEFRHFVDEPIPADFFGPGSEPFDGTIELGGQPLQTNPPGILGGTDLIIRRTDPFDRCQLPAPNQTTVPIEIVALHLQSIQPISIIIDGIETPWMVDLTLSPSAVQPPGFMDVKCDCEDGGTFTSELPVIPRLTFTRVDMPTQVVVMDFDGLPPIILDGPQGGWSTHEIPPFQLHNIPPATTVDHDANPSTPDLPLLPSSPGFFPGLSPVECNPTVVGPSPCQGVSIYRQSAWEMILNSVPVLVGAPPVLGATCLPDGRCVMTDLACANAVGGTYLGDGTVCGPFVCGLPPLPGITFEQVDFLFDSLTNPNSRHGRVEINPDPILFPSAFGIDSGFVNIFTDRGWVVQNLWLNFNDGVGDISTYFDISPFDGHDVAQLSAFIDFTPSPLPFFIDGPRSIYTVGDWGYNAEGAWATPADLVTFVGDPFAPGSMPFSLTGFYERHTQPNKVNVQAANNQCVPMSVANSLQYLEDRYGLPIPQPHVAGLKGDSTLVGHLGTHMGRNVTSRTNGAGVTTPPSLLFGTGMVAGKFAYLKANGLEKKLVQKHQGTRAGTGGLTPAGDFTASGITTKDESVNGKVTWDWICNEIKKGEDVELIFGYYDSTGRHGGHAVRVFECGKTLGVPWLGYVHDALQTDQDPGDSRGLECVRKYLVDTDNDSVLNLGENGREVDFAFSESADNDMDGVTQGLDNAPNHWNPGQEDADGNGIGDVAESPILAEDPVGPIELIPAFGSFGSPFFVNPKPTIPDHKDIWFVGTATSVSANTARVSIAFEIMNGALLTSIETGDTTEILPGATREIFGGARLDFCPDSVRVIIKSDNANIANIAGTLSHICYGISLLGCCDTPGDFNNDGTFNIGDVTAGIARIFVPGSPAPSCQDEADFNSDGAFNIGDVTAGIARIFVPGSPAPVCGTTGS